MLARALALAFLFLVAACTRDVDERRSLQKTQQSITTPRELSLQLPRGAPLHQVALAASSSLNVGSEALIRQQAGLAMIASSGSGDTDVGNDSKVGSVISVGPVTLRNRVLVSGDVRTEATSVKTGTGVTVSGVVETSAALSPPVPFAWTIDFAMGTDDVRVEAGVDRTLAAGAYRDVRVEGGGTLRLVGGTYFVRAFRTQPGSRVVVDASAGPVFLYVGEALDMKTPFEAQGAEDRILLGYLGNGIVSIASPFAGTVVAPGATVKLDPAAGPYRGSFFAENIQVGPRAEVILEPFAAWDFLFPPTVLLECVEHFDATHSTALWGYDNPLDVTVTIPVGTRNNFVPSVATPITVFEPGRHDGALRTPFSTTELTWFLSGAAVVANTNTSRRCTFADIPPSSNPTPLEKNGEGSRPPQPHLLLVRGPLNFNGASTLGLPNLVTPGPFPTPVFKFTLDGARFGDDAVCGPTLLYATTTINGFPFLRRNFESGSDSQTYEMTGLNPEIPPTQPTVDIKVDLHEEDSAGCGGGDDHILTLDLKVDNTTGVVVSAGLVVYDSDGNVASSSFLEPHERCATGLDGFGLCWRAVPTGKPRVCTAYNAQFVDGGGEDFAGGTGMQQIDASFARAALIVQSGTRRSDWSGFLDKDGCVPPEGVPPGEQWQTTSPLTITLGLLTEQCFDDPPGRPPTDACLDPAGTGGARFKETRAEDTRPDGTRPPARLCTVWTTNPALETPQGCTLVVNAFPGWTNQAPPNPVRLVGPAFFESTNLAAVASHMLKLEADPFGVGLGITEALIDRTGFQDPRGTAGLVELEANDAYCFQASCAPTAICIRDGSCDTASGEPIKFRPDDPDGPQPFGDAFWKFVVAHEIGHKIQQRAMGIPNSEFERVQGVAAECSCGHITGTNTLHCLQSLEHWNAAQAEGYAQFFASRVWNQAAGSDCTFRYYKEFFNDVCMPGAEDGCVAGAGGVGFISKPPVPVSCVLPTRWRNNKCFGAGVVPGDVVTDYGTEFDWMGFYYGMNTQGAPTERATMGELFGAYRFTCNDDNCVQQQLAFEACTGAFGGNCRPGVGGLRDGAQQYFASKNRASTGQRFQALGDVYGVSRSTQR